MCHCICRVKLFDPFDAFNAHILGDLDGIGAPGGDHLFPRADENTINMVPEQNGGVAEKPCEFFEVFLCQVNPATNCIND